MGVLSADGCFNVPMVSLFAVPSGASPLPSALRRVIALIIVNLGLSAALTVLVLIFNHSLINYQVAHTALQPGVNEVVLRASLQLASWSRLVGVGVVALVYFFLVKRLREGRRRAYLRTIVLAVVGLAGLALIASTTRPRIPGGCMSSRPFRRGYSRRCCGR